MEENSSKPLTIREMQLFKIALRYLKRYDDSNPEVGMGPSSEQLVLRIANETGIYPSPDQIKVLEKYLNVQ